MYELEKFKSLRIGDKAPRFIADTTDGKIKLSDYTGNWLILFSHPGDYTPVCTTEFLEFSKMYSEFKSRNCKLLGLSIDSTPSHLSWLNNIHNSTGVKVPFPVIADRDMTISKMYGMIAPNISNTETIRSVFIIDPEQTIRAILQYPKTNGRNVIEIMRLLDALQTTDKEKVATPANWIPGKSTILSSPTTFDEVLKNKNNLGNNCIDWYLCYNQRYEPYDF